MVDFYGIGKYTSPMDPMGWGFLCNLDSQVAMVLPPVLHRQFSLFFALQDEKNWRLNTEFSTRAEWCCKMFLFVLNRGATNDPFEFLVKCWICWINCTACSFRSFPVLGAISRGSGFCWICPIALVLLECMRWWRTQSAGIAYFSVFQSVWTFGFSVNYSPIWSDLILNLFKKKLLGTWPQTSII